MTRGTPPPSVPIPAEDGYYWLRLATPRYVHVPGPMNEPCKSYWTWEPPQITVELCWIHDGMTDWMASDESGYIETEEQRLIEVIAKLEVPK